MASFSELWSIIENEKSASPLMGSGEDSRALNVVRAGKNLRDEGESSFWDDFISLCSNEGLAELLDVNRDKLASWPAKIKEHLDKLTDHDHEGPNHAEDVELLATGDNGAFTVPSSATNSDPNLGEF